MKLKKGFTLVEIMLVVAIISLLAAIAIPSFRKSRMESRKNSCVNNLRLIDHAKQQLATASQTLTDTYVPVMSDIVVYIQGASTAPVCRDGGSYTVNAVSSVPTCSLSAAPFLHVMSIDVH